jgi:hypothetical protein
MTEIIHRHATVEQDGEVHVANVPVKRGRHVEVTIRIASVEEAVSSLTAEQLLASDVVGMWKDRTDIGDSVDFARQLRAQAQLQPQSRLH